MEARAIYITEYDVARLRKLLDKASPQERRGNQYLESLEAELARAHVLAPAEIPANVITMNSVAHLVDLDTRIAEHVDGDPITLGIDDVSLILAGMAFTEVMSMEFPFFDMVQWTSDFVAAELRKYWTDEEWLQYAG